MPTYLPGKITVGRPRFSPLSWLLYSAGDPAWSGPPEGAIAALLYHETTEFSNTGVFPTQDEPEKAGVGTGRAAGECESRCNMLSVSRWRRWRSLRPPAAASALAAPTARRSMASSRARFGRGCRSNQQWACSSASWISCMQNGAARHDPSGDSCTALMPAPGRSQAAVSRFVGPTPIPGLALARRTIESGGAGVHLRSENASWPAFFRRRAYDRGLSPCWSVRSLSRPASC